MSGADDAKTLEELAKVAQTMAATSFNAYQDVFLGFWKMGTGTTEPDTEAASKGMTTLVGTMASDLSNLMAVWQKAIEISSKTDEPGGGDGGDGDTGGT